MNLWDFDCDASWRIMRKTFSDNGPLECYMYCLPISWIYFSCLVSFLLLCKQVFQMPFMTFSEFLLIWNNLKFALFVSLAAVGSIYTAFILFLSYFWVYGHLYKLYLKLQHLLLTFITFAPYTFNIIFYLDFSWTLNSLLKCSLIFYIFYLAQLAFY